MEVPQAQQIHLLSEKIMMDKADFNVATITTLMDGNHVTFADAVARVLQYVSHFFPASSTFAWHARGNISAVNVSQITQERRGEKYLYNRLTSQTSHTDMCMTNGSRSRISGHKYKWRKTVKVSGRRMEKPKLYTSQQPKS